MSLEPSRVARFAGLAALGLIVALWSGCASPATSAGMTAEVTVPKVAQRPESASVLVAGGSETTATTAPQISNRDFAEAIQAAIVKSGVFAKIAPADQADYQITVMI